MSGVGVVVGVIRAMAFRWRWLLEVVFCFQSSWKQLVSPQIPGNGALSGWLAGGRLPAAVGDMRHVQRKRIGGS